MIRIKNCLHSNRQVLCRKILVNKNIFIKRKLINNSYTLQEVNNSISVNQDEYAKNENISLENCDFRCILPPPNITGTLHIGHALTITLEDVLNRFYKLKGKNIVWHPGFDHAGIATQTVIEKNLWNTEKKLPSDMEKTDFLNYCDNWKEQKIQNIQYQIDKMGPLINWNHSYYTMDNKFSRAVNSAFIDLHSKNLIYRDKRIVNWCSSLKSVISDQEVVKVPIKAGDFLEIPGLNCSKRKIQFGRLFRVKYKLVDSNKYVEIETSRPETIFADVAIAVNPNDSRYLHLIGNFVYNPLVKDQKIEIVPSRNVDINFGTGVLKLTPNHSQVDYDIVTKLVQEGQLDKNLLNSKCIDEKGCIVAPNSPFNGMDKFVAREEIINYLTTKGVLYETTNNNYCTEIPICERTGNVVEPVLKTQWFMKTCDLHEEIKNFLLSGQIQLLPEFHHSNLLHWLSNTNPWCLSRQIIWGHQIPAFKINNTKFWLVKNPEDESIKNSALNLTRDTDVLDTWFSSSLIPIVTGGWPNIKIPRELSYIETGHDILGFWVARMLVVCYAITGTLPFRKILLHGLIRDSLGRKMSKSLGNVIDPLDIIDGITLNEMKDRIDKSLLSINEKIIAKDNCSEKYPEGIKEMGADVLRYALLHNDVTALDVKIDLLNLASEGNRFCNKLWQMTKYANKILSSSEFKLVKLTHPLDIWIQSRFGECISDVEKSLIYDFEPHIAFEHIRKFIKNQFCDRYVEVTKIAAKSGDTNRMQEIRTTIYVTLDGTFRLLSIFMPQISNYLHKEIVNNPNCLNLKNKDKSFLELKRSFYINSNLNFNVRKFFSLVEYVNNLRKSYGISKDENILSAFLIVDSDFQRKYYFNSILANAIELCNLECQIVYESEKDNLSLEGFMGYSFLTEKLDLYIKLPSKCLEQEISKLESKKESLLKKKDKYIKIIESTQKSLENSSFRAKNKKIEKMNERAENVKRKIEVINTSISNIEENILIIKKNLGSS